jgi:hypothetical protein
VLAVATAEGVAFITGGATIIAAVILGGLAAWTAERRQAAALAHDRELADLADLRSLLDEAAVALNRADDGRAASEVRFTERPAHMPDETMNEVRDAGRALFTLRERLYVRLGREDPMARSFASATTALLSMWHAARSLQHDDSATAVQEARRLLRENRDAFERARVGGCTPNQSHT